MKAYGSAIRRSVSLRILFGKAMVAKWFVNVMFCEESTVEARICGIYVARSEVE